MSGRAVVVILILVVAVGVGLALGIVHVMSEGQSTRMARPPRKRRKTFEETPAPPRKRASKNLREFMKLVARTNWYHSTGKGFRSKAGAWQDAVSGRRPGLAPLLDGPEACEATAAYLLWDRGSDRAVGIGDRLLTAGKTAGEDRQLRSIHRILTATGHPRVKELGPALKALQRAGARPPRPSKPGACKLWLEISTAR
jgi:hypothetical protein